MRSRNVFLDYIEKVINQGMKLPALNAVPAFSFTVRLDRGTVSIERMVQASFSAVALRDNRVTSPCPSTSCTPVRYHLAWTRRK